MNPQYPCKICKNEVKNKDPSICCDLCNIWSYIQCANISPKTYEKLYNDDVSTWYCPICVKNVPFSDLKTKGLRMLLSSDTLEHTQKPQTLQKNLNKQTRGLMGKFSQISQLNGPNKNNVGCAYYVLIISIKL